jgi:RES domain-containing protein
MLEKLVHTGGQIPKHQVCVTFDVPDDLPLTLLDADTVPGWSDEDYTVSRRAGDAWLVAAQTAILLVPSVVFDVERNALINPSHSATPRIRVASIEAIRWDDRLFTPRR